MTRALCRSDQPGPFSNHIPISSANTLPRAPVDVSLSPPPLPFALDPSQSKTPHVMHRCAQHTQVRAPHASSLISSLCLSFAFVTPTGRLVLRYDAFCRPQSTVDTHDWMAVAKKKGVSSRVVFKSGRGGGGGGVESSVGSSVKYLSVTLNSRPLGTKGVEDGRRSG